VLLYRNARLTSQMGKKRKWLGLISMSDLPSKADIVRETGSCPKGARFEHASLYRREVAPTASGHCDLPVDFPKVISGLRRPIAIQAAISLNMNLPE
jgi:hypothetical protein